MRTSVLLMVTALIYGLYGLGFMFMPNELISLYGGELGSIGAFTTQMYASMLLGTATLCWFARDAERDTALVAILTGMLVATTLGFIIVGLNQFNSPTANNFAWLPTIIQGLMAAGFLQARFKLIDATD